MPVTYTLPGGGRTVVVTADLTGLAEAGVTEVVLMNELGAREFDLYEDADGASLRGDAIGTWDAVTAPRGPVREHAAWRRVLARADAGRDAAPRPRARRLPPRLGGLRLSVPPALRLFGYEVRIERPA